MGCSNSKSMGQVVGLQAKGNPKSRCALMMKEVALLQTNVKAVVKEIRSWQGTSDKTLDSIKQLLATPLPKIYETDNAAAEALMHPTVATVAGEGFSSDQANRAKDAFTMSAAPRQMESWLGLYDEAVAKQKLLNKSYDELHNARSKVANARGKEEALRRGGATGEDSKLVSAVRHVHQLQDRLDVATENYKHEEEAQYIRLVQLINEACDIGPAIRERLGEMADALTAVRDAVPLEGGSPLATPAPAPPAVDAATALAAVKDAHLTTTGRDSPRYAPVSTPVAQPISQPISQPICQPASQVAHPAPTTEGFKPGKLIMGSAPVQAASQVEIPAKLTVPAKGAMPSPTSEVGVNTPTKLAVAAPAMAPA